MDNETQPPKRGRGLSKPKLVPGVDLIRYRALFSDGSQLSKRSTLIPGRFAFIVRWTSAQGLSERKVGFAANELSAAKMIGRFQRRLAVGSHSVFTEVVEVMLVTDTPKRDANDKVLIVLWPPTNPSGGAVNPQWAKAVGKNTRHIVIAETKTTYTIRIFDVEYKVDKVYGTIRGPKDWKGSPVFYKGWKDE